LDKLSVSEARERLIAATSNLHVRATMWRPFSLMQLTSLTRIVSSARLVVVFHRLLLLAGAGEGMREVLT
jgi:hypothetical protein